MKHLAVAEQTLLIDDNPFFCAIQAPPRREEASHPTGAPIWRLLAVRYRTRDGRWEDGRLAVLEAATETERRLRFSGSGGIELLLTLQVAADLLHVTLAVADSPGQESKRTGDEVVWLGVDLQAAADEHFLGLGERFDSLDQRGKQIDLWVTNAAQRNLTYIPIPFYLSSAGYGLHLDTDSRAVIRFATPDEPGVVSLRGVASPVAASLRFTVIPGAPPQDILSRYTALAGRPATPPAWVFGPWKSRDWQTEDQASVFEDADMQRSLDLPATVKLIDARWETSYHTFTFDSQKYPNPTEMIRHLHQQGYRLVLWTSPWMVDDGQPTGVYRFCAERGFLIKNRQGETYVHRLGNSPTFFGSCFDFTNPAAVAWWQEQIHRLVEMGASGFKTDFGEQVPEDALFHDGRTGGEMHNAFPRLYNRVTYEAMSAALHRRPAPLADDAPGVLLARSGWHGSQGISAIWAGDQTADFAAASGLPSAIIAGQSAGLSGFPFWGSDIGGYFGIPTDGVFIRWAQFGAFSPIMQIHGAGPREPWRFTAQTLAIYRQYAKIHIELFPYLYTYARLAAATGLPIMRALALEFPEDPRIWDAICEHEYCLGSELLVAPVYDGFDGYRLLYLPEGAWRDFWTGEAVQGGRVVRHPAALPQIPVFARAGALIPRLDPTPDTLIQPLPNPDTGVRTGSGDLRLDIYPGADGQFRLFDGTRFAWQDAPRLLTLANAQTARSIAIRLVGEAAQLHPVIATGEAAPPIHIGSLAGETAYSRVCLAPGQELHLRWPTP